MKLFSEIEDIFYSIYKILYVNERLILYFTGKSECMELEMNNLDTPTVFCDQYSQLCHIPAPSFNIITWNAFVKMIFERAQVLES